MSIIINEGFIKAEMISETLINFVINKHEIDMHDTYRICSQLKELKRAGVSGKNALILEFHGYDNDPREIYEIPEIRMYLKGVFNKFPEIFYFLNVEAYTFAILTNSIFTNHEEVYKADRAILDYAGKNGDREKVITVSYYAEHQEEFHN